MGKRRKAGNINPKKQLKKQGTAYYNREQEINYLLNNLQVLFIIPTLICRILSHTNR